jgi:tetratricopeptide (TPR) repeat protein
LDYGRKHSDVRCIARHYFAMGYGRHAAGDFPSTIEFVKKCIQVTPDPMISHAAKTVLGMSYLATGQLKNAQNTLEEVIEHSEKFGYEFTGAISQTMKGLVLIAQGDLKQGVSIYSKTLQALFESKSLYRYVMGCYLMGIIYSRIDQERAEEYLNIAIKVAEEIGAKSYFGQAYLGLGQLHKTKGMPEKARECITHAIDAFEKCEADVFLKQAKEALAALG